MRDRNVSFEVSKAGLCQVARLVSQSSLTDLRRLARHGMFGVKTQIHRT